MLIASIESIENEESKCKEEIMELCIAQAIQIRNFGVDFKQSAVYNDLLMAIWEHIFSGNPCRPNLWKASR